MRENNAAQLYWNECYSTDGAIKIAYSNLMSVHDEVEKQTNLPTAIACISIQWTS